MALEQCSVLFVKNGPEADSQIKALRSLGFRVVESQDLPATEEFSRYHAVVVRLHEPARLTTVATRLRAKPRFGHRVLIALVPCHTTDREKRDAVNSGFSLTMPLDCSARDLAASILRVLRPHPEYRCLLRSPTGRRKAA